MSDILTEKQCVPCEGGLAPLLPEEITRLLPEINGWHLGEDSAWLRKSWKFPDFARALQWVNQVGEIAESQGHHPDIRLGWGYAEIALQTHAIGGLHENDFILAAKIDILPM